ncbi:transglutaminase domain-containing protein [Actinomadura flavalba]|uniref:transglutaminase domain-containing protein n=1 Tax=Actinomadura flavalba TaxID=1120938 RepID=UPI0003827D39|nr:transglutaminase domain-containing protein [Actinomadura flavalba]
MRLPFRQTPGDLAVFDTTGAEAAELLRAGPEVADELAAAGLQHRRDADHGPLFDYSDVVNTALRQGTGMTVPELAQRLLMRFAAGDPDGWHTPLEWTVAVRPVADPRGASWRYAVPDLTADGVRALDQDGVDPGPDGRQDGPYRARVRITGDDHRVGDPAVQRLFDDVLGPLSASEVVYQAIGERLRAAPGRAWTLGVADCVVAARVLTDRLRRAGYRARTRRGLLLGPIGNDHAWTEVWEDGAWRCLDPVFAHLGATHARGNAAAFRAACRGGRLNRLLPCAAEENAPLIAAPDGTAAPQWAFGAVTARAVAAQASPVTSRSI